jgi:hypothetical protein
MLLQRSLPQSFFHGAVNQCAPHLQVMLSDIEACSDLGAHGVVFGCLMPDGDVDVDATRQLVHQAQKHVRLQAVSDLQPGTRINASATQSCVCSVCAPSHQSACSENQLFDACPVCCKQTLLRCAVYCCALLDRGNMV